MKNWSIQKETDSKEADNKQEGFVRGSYYDSMTLKLIKERNLVLELIQKNSIENFVQDCLPYILNSHGPYYYYFSLP